MLFSQVSTNTTVTYTVPTIADIAFSGNPAAFSITPGAAATINTSTTYSVTTNLTSQRITASLNTNMPTGVTLEVSLQAPTGATSTGLQTLDTTQKNLVTGISKLTQSGLTVTYRISATVAASTAGAATRIITYTLIT